MLNKEILEQRKRYARKNRRRRDVCFERMFLFALKQYSKKQCRKLGIAYTYQKVIGKYIVDFYFEQRNLIVEIDENFHVLRKEYDQTRENYLKSFGFNILRFTQDQIENDVYGCLEQVFQEPVLSDYRSIKERAFGCAHNPKYILRGISIGTG